MRVRVELGGRMHAALPGGRALVVCPERTTAGDLLEMLGVLPGPCRYVINGEVTADDAVLRDGDELHVSPMAVPSD